MASSEVLLAHFATKVSSILKDYTTYALNETLLKDKNFSPLGHYQVPIILHVVGYAFGVRRPGLPVVRGWCCFTLAQRLPRPLSTRKGKDRLFYKHANNQVSFIVAISDKSWDKLQGPYTQKWLRTWVPLGTMLQQVLLLKC